MPKYIFHIHTGYVGGDIEDEREYDIEPTEEELNGDLDEFVWDHISSWYEKVEG